MGYFVLLDLLLHLLPRCDQMGYAALCGVLLLLGLCERVSSEATLTIRNRCRHTVWPGMLSNAGVTPAAIPASGAALDPGESTAVIVPRGWSGRLWGRAGCTFSSTGVGKCQSGDCGGKLHCSGSGPEPPVTLVELAVQSANLNLDFYDVSLVDGFNLPLLVTPTNQTCHVANCSANINEQCPAELQVTDSSRSVIACKSACNAFKTPQYCCSGAYAGAGVCKPSSYAKIFKSLCPGAYSYAFDDPTSIRTCLGANYDITFCPFSSSSHHYCLHVSGYGGMVLTKSIMEKHWLACILSLVVLWNVLAVDNIFQISSHL